MSNPFLRPGEHWDPYAKAWRKNLTEAEVQDLWPYRTKKEAPVVEPIHDWLEETLTRAGLDKTQPDTLTAAPTRMLTPMDSASARAPSEAELTVIGEMVNNMLDMADMVTLPGHYARFKIEPIRFICENNLNFFQGNIVKYILRFDAKNGLEDLRKARRYLDMFIKFVEGDPNWWAKEA